jgi:4-hydroxybenzoate polyprenyltransferase
MASIITIDRDKRECPEAPIEPSTTEPPLIIDAETCLKTDLLLEYLLALLRTQPRCLFLLPFWLAKGRDRFEREIVSRASLDLHLLPFRLDFLTYLEEQRAQGRSLILLAKKHLHVIRPLAANLMLFDEVIAIDLPEGLERDLLAQRFGVKHFDYATSGRSGMLVLPLARKVILVEPCSRSRKSVATFSELDKVFEKSNRGSWIAPIRPRHWLKNLLVFTPLLAAHRFGESDLLGKSLLAFVALCCCASSGYLFNDLLDLAADRHHPRKRFRPFAAGDLPLSYALLLGPVLVVLASVLGAMVSGFCLALVLAYFVLTLSYSLYLKKIALLDVLVLAGLYTLRIMVGSAAVAIWPSPWLLAFSMFLFVSLAFIKRYSELTTMRAADGEAANARGYEAGDAELISAKGTASGYLAVLVLAFYITNGPAHTLYGRHQFMWILCPLLLYWIGHMWLVAHRGKMNDDPVLFASSDRTSLILIFLMLVTAALAL